MKLIKLLVAALVLVCFSLQVPAFAQTCGVDSDGDGVYSKSCDLTDQYAKCSVTADACNSAADCPVGECSVTGGACADAADCPINVCSTNGAPCSSADDCPDYGPNIGVCIASQTCEAITQTCDDVATCSSEHPTEVACAADADCNGICTYTGQPCDGIDLEIPGVCTEGFCSEGLGNTIVCSVDSDCDAIVADCSFGACVISGATCITSYTCLGDGGDCVEDADCAEVCDPADNCPDDVNPGQADGDGDGIGDECDPTPQPCAADLDEDGVFAGSCDLADQYAKCSLTEEACTSAAGCSTGQCNVTAGACTDAADCPSNICNNGGAPCTIDANCPTWGSPGVCITGQTCDVVTQTCDDLATCSGHAAEHACTADADCNGVCTYTAEPCAADADCSFGGCVTSGSTCITYYTCEATGVACTVNTDCEATCLSVDICTDVANPGQADGDNVEIGDICDNCPNAASSNQEDVDSDGTGDVCDDNTVYGYISGDVVGGVNVVLYVSVCGIPQPYDAAISDAQGYYAAGDIVNGQYQILPEEDGYSFDAVSWHWVYIPQGPGQSFDWTSTAD
jgi:hypothetical protein